MNKFVLLLCFYLCIDSVLSQSISITIKDEKKNPIQGVAVRLTKIKDSTTTINITDKTGKVTFNGLESTLYHIKISHVGYEPIEKGISIKEENRNFSFELKKAIITLGEVSVSAPKPLIRQEDDKTIIDPLPLINTSTNTLEVLEKTPGIFVDQDGGIFLSSLSPAAIYINGREQKLNTQDIVALLRNLPPNSIDKIEVIRSPSTKYDASTTGGIVNIILKKGVKIGQFGSVNAGFNQGFYGNQFAGFNYNFTNNKTNGYVNINYNHNDKLEKTQLFRQLKNDTTLFQTSHSRQQSHQAYIGYGINYEIHDKINFTYDGRLNGSLPLSTNQNANKIKTSEDLLLAELYNYTNSFSKFFNLQQDFGINWKIDTSASLLETKFSYNYNVNNLDKGISSDYSFPITYKTNTEEKNSQNRNFIILQSDLTYQFPYKIKFESGIKSTYQSYNSNNNSQKETSGTWITDSNRINAFNYKENINAIYLQTSKTFGKYLVIKAGIRMEHTYMKGHQTLPNDTNFIINRADFFPYVYISRRIIKLLGIELKGFLIYRRSINRPGYQNLNPSKNFIDEFLYETGNPALKPQFTDNYEVNLSFQDTPVLAFGQNFTRDIFTNVEYRDKNNEAVSVRTYDNTGKNTETYFRLIVGIPPGKKYFFAVGAQYNYNNYNGAYENKPFEFQRGSWRLFTFHSLNLFKNTKITLSGFMMIKGQNNFYILKNFGQLNMSINQSFLNNRLNISISARDILRTMLTKFELHVGSQYTYGDRYSDNQRFGVNLRYTFGISKKPDKKDMLQYHNEDE